MEQPSAAGFMQRDGVAGRLPVTLVYSAAAILGLARAATFTTSLGAVEMPWRGQTAAQRRSFRLDFMVDGQQQHRGEEQRATPRSSRQQRADLCFEALQGPRGLDLVHADLGGQGVASREGDTGVLEVPLGRRGMISRFNGCL